MPDLTLENCVPVQILAPLEETASVNLGFSVGGSAGEGRVDVKAGAGELPAPIPLPTGSSGTILIPGITTLTVHFRMSPGGPDSISFSSTATVLP